MIAAALTATLAVARTSADGTAARAPPIVDTLGSAQYESTKVFIEDRTQSTTSSWSR